MPHPDKPFISIILPCLNEENSVAPVIRNIKEALKNTPFKKEIIVVDNGSSDRSATIAGNLKVKVLIEKSKGYGRALKTGINNANGNLIIMVDCDNTYDLSAIPLFVNKIRQGYDLVLGSRFKGRISKGAMSFLRRYIGNPLLTLMLNLFYSVRLSDSQTGFRAFTKKSFNLLKMRGNGMEFASEMIIKAIFHRLKISEIPINYYKRKGKSKLSPLIDAVRHIKYMLLYSPAYSFIIPGLSLLCAGSIISLWLLPGGKVLFGWFFDIHTMTVSLLFANLGLQLILLGLISRTYSLEILDLPPGPLARLVLKFLTSSRLFLSGILLGSIGFYIIFSVSLAWIFSGFSSLSKIREFIFAVGVFSLGTQLVFSSFLLSLMKEEV